MCLNFFQEFFINAICNSRLKNKEILNYFKYNKDHFKRFLKLVQQIEVNKKKLKEVDTKEIVQQLVKELNENESHQEVHQVEKIKEFGGKSSKMVGLVQKFVFLR